MGAKNCPETPRQKMIGMMYLVLTAMLALNVSADVLDAFAKVQRGLNAVILSTKDKNEKSYSDLNAARILNPKKMDPVCAKTKQIQEKSKEIYDFIESLKQRMVKEADGISADTLIDFNFYDIESKSNLDIGGQIMLKTGEGQGVLMKNKLNEYRELVKSFIDPVKGKSLRDAIDKFLDTNDKKELTGGGSKPWEDHCFESIPLVGVVTLMTLYQSNILTIESDAIKYLFSEVDAESFKFNKLEAKIIPTSTYVLRNGKFEAEIMLIATDTTKQPDVLIKGQKVPYNTDRKAFYTEAATKVGSGFKVEGNIKYVTSSGRENLYPFSTTYDVGEPQVVISATKMNVFYLGVENPVSIAAPGFKPEELKVALSTGGSIKSTGNGYIVRPVKEGTCDVVVSVDKDGKPSRLQAQTFRVKKVPDPVAMVGKKKAGDRITKNEIIAAGGVSAVLENFDFDMKFEIVSFNVFTIIDGYIQDASSKNSSFTGQQRSIVQKLKRGQIFGVEKIMAKGPDGVVRNLPSISYRID